MPRSLFCRYVESRAELEKPVLFCLTDFEIKMDY